MSDFALEELRGIATALGISTEGKSAEQLRAVIKGVVQKPAAPSTSLSDPWDAMSEHFKEGRFTDCTIRVKIRRGRRGTAMDVSIAQEESVHVIKAHAVILASRFASFKRAMGGKWRESQDRSLEVEVADEQEYVTFRRLIKLCYGTTFIKKGDRDLDVSELVRLIHVANAFECMDAVKQCKVALQEMKLGWERAVQCIELTDTLKGMEGMRGLPAKAAAVLVKELGPVDELFVPVEDEDDGGDVLGGLKLSQKVKDLSPEIFQVLLSSNRLQLKTENETFWLLLAWVEAQSEESEEGKQVLFTRMAKHLRFNAMNPGYILMMVSEHPRIISAGLQGEALRESLGQASLAMRTPEQVTDMKKNQFTHDSGPPSSRAPPGKVKWLKGATFTAADIGAVTSTYKHCRKRVGLVAGIPWDVVLGRLSAYGQAHRAWLYTGCDAVYGWESRSVGSGVVFSYCISVGARRSVDIKPSPSGSWFVTDGSIWGDSVEAWTEISKPGSEWLRGRGLDVKLTITTCNHQTAHPEVGLRE